MARSYKPPAIRWADRFISAQGPAIKGPPSEPAPQSEQSPDEQEQTARIERVHKQLETERLSNKARKKIGKQQRERLQQERLRARLLSQRKSVEQVAHERQETIKEYNRGARNAQRTVNSERNSRLCLFSHNASVLQPASRGRVWGGIGRSPMNIPYVSNSMD